MKLDLPKVIALDLDGTLLPESKEITPRSRRALRRLRGRGVEIVLATGKFLHLARRYAEELELETPVIALDGARITDGDSGMRSIAGIDRATADEMLAELIDDDWDLFADNGADQLLLRSQNELMHRITSVWAEEVHTVERARPALVGDPGVMAFYGPRPESERCAEEIHDRFPSLRVTWFDSPAMGKGRVTVQPARTSKGHALEAVLEHWSIEPAECMVFGDWLNDLPMFEIGAVGVAMANAVPEVRAVADLVTGRDCEKDGVACFLERHFL